MGRSPMAVTDAAQMWVRFVKVRSLPYRLTMNGKSTVMTMPTAMAPKNDSATYEPDRRRSCLRYVLNHHAAQATTMTHERPVADCVPMVKTIVEAITAKRSQRRCS